MMTTAPTEQSKARETAFCFLPVSPVKDFIFAPAGARNGHHRGRSAQIQVNLDASMAHHPLK